MFLTKNYWRKKMLNNFNLGDTAYMLVRVVGMEVDADGKLFYKVATCDENGNIDPDTIGLVNDFQLNKVF